MTTPQRALSLAAVLALAAGCSKKTEENPTPAAVDAAAATPPPTSKPADAAVVAVAADAAAVAEPDAAVVATRPDKPPVKPDKPPVKPDKPPAEPDVEPPDEKPTNLKLLSKKWSREQVESYMKTFNKALGVECEYCHVDDKDYASDANELKLGARKMISLTRSLNRSYFGGKSKISCKTCHKGAKKPGGS